MSRLSRILATLFALSMIAAACGSSGDGASDGTSGSNDTSKVVADVKKNEAEGTDSRGPGDPVRGGKLVYGIEADSANPWVHYATSCAISCRMIFKAISDPLFMTAADGTIQPYLVKTAEHSADYKVWTLTIRDKVTFHDGTPLDGEAVKYNIDACRKSPLTGPAFLGLSDTKASGQTVTLTYAAPEAVPMAVIRDEVCGYMFSPTWIKTLKNNPLLTTDAEKAAATGNPAAPIGLGPFKFKSYTPGNGNSFLAERNPDYWRGDGANSTKEGLPYLDEVEYVVAVDIQGRSSGLQSGGFDIIHTANAEEAAKYKDNKGYVTLLANDFGETSYTLLNVGEGENPTLAAVRGKPNLPMDPTGVNKTNPLVHLSCRKALAEATDTARVAKDRNAGLATAANGPFPPGSLGYLADSGYPKFDVTAAKADFETCKKESGQNPVALTFNTTNDPFNVETNELIGQMWTDAFGDEVKVSITPIEQGQYIGLALAGTFQAQGWRNHGGVDPTEQWYWWNSATASPIDPSVPELALNFGRFQDPEMDAQFKIIRQNPDPAARKAAAEQVNKLFGKNVWNFWLYWTVWAVISNPRVQNITDLKFPDSGPLSKPIISGKHNVTQIWCLEGKCQA
jgi:peptide/nickel transport system substrate-binding protein